MPVVVEERAFYDRIISEGKVRNEEKAHKYIYTHSEQRQQQQQQQDEHEILSFPIPIEDQAAGQEINDMNENVFVIDGLRYNADGKLLE